MKETTKEATKGTMKRNKRNYEKKRRNNGTTKRKMKETKSMKEMKGK